LPVKLKGRQFGTIEVIETESQAVLNTQITAFRMHLRMAEALGTVPTRGKGLLREWWWPVDPKLVFDRMAAAVPESMDSFLYPSSLDRQI
jgi:hypothetical protein